ncbi:hypothetical protein [Fulvivirga lutea]|uniref:DUF3868 domain-containing protein n=1 Tax=Fulvivirga lutea TaxID=2810512 RepID=A0A974WEZ2_9BACT|nr:hypothetical protein [Fulvivirga lutea]QSE97214.1 hypothetical protein JR347_16730 [Fulvivirga lutea]
MKYLKVCMFFIFSASSLLSFGQKIHTNSDLYLNSIDTVLNSIKTNQFTELSLKLPLELPIPTPEKIKNLSVLVHKGKRSKVKAEQLYMVVKPLQVSHDILMVPVLLYHRPKGDLTFYDNAVYRVNYKYSKEANTYYVESVEYGWTL